MLTLVEQAQQEQRALRLAARQMAQCCGADPARQLPAAQVLAFAGSVEAASARIDQQLTDIMLAQDFHDLTGQVLAKVAALVTDLDGSLQRLQVRALAPARPDAEPPAQPGRGRRPAGAAGALKTGSSARCSRPFVSISCNWACTCTA